MPATTAHETACNCICLSGNAGVVGASAVPDSTKPYNYSTPCEWQLSEEELLSMVISYYSPSGPAELSSVISASGDLYMYA
ncbi:hypothetical protein FRC08_005270 [Ceratobasidium sp. 394]|nr:hypothetical protein FRC08_005270 [Ceratobasidium sp. 394]